LTSGKIRAAYELLLSSSPSGLRPSALVIREQVIKPLLAGVRTPALSPTPSIPTQTDQHYERLRLAIQPLFEELGIAA